MTIRPTIHPTIIFRVPRFSHSETIEFNWNDLKECIRLSSPDFYQIIGDMSFQQFLTAEKKIQLTARKYYNRAMFRSTPYGLFASIGVSNLSWNGQSEIQMDGRFTVHSFADWQDKMKELPPFTEMAANTLLFSNSTYYTVDNEIRFIQKLESDHQIVAVDFAPIISAILGACHAPAAYTEIRDEMNLLDENMLHEYIQDMIDLQLLFTSMHPNIIGQDYFARTGQLQGTKQKQYLIAERKAKEGSLDQRIFRHLPDLVIQMQKIVESEESAELKSFRERFVQKFDGAEVPLMVALDPEIGIGYGGYESHKSNSPLLQIFDDSGKQNDSTINSPLIQKLYKQVLDKSINGQSIELDDLINEGTKENDLPNSFLALCTPIDGEIYLQSLGGHSATAILGRFASAVPDVHEHCIEIASMEQQSNPSVLFFDVGYTKEDTVDNVNRRPTIYQFQLNILNYDTSQTPLCANDILVSVQKGKVILRSRTLNKGLVPRFTSAYNYRRSDLSLFRLMMDIQAQGIQGNLIFKPYVLIPDLPYYPAVKFRNIIVTPATWLINKTILKDTDEWDQKCGKLSEYLQSRITCTYIKTGSGDQTLFLDNREKGDIEILVSLLEKEGVLYVEEAYLPKESSVTDHKGSPFLPQVIVTLTHQKVIYSMENSVKEKLAIEKKEWVSPGKEWIYFEIYTSPFRSDQLLSSKIKHYLKTNRMLIKSWFFIRYNENGDHIRLRLRLTDVGQGYNLIQQLSDLLNSELNVGTVSDIKICTYKKEVHRYSASLIEQVEEHFYRDSQFVLNMLGSMLTDFGKYRLCIAIFEKISDSMVVPEGEFDQVLKAVVESLKVEHSFGTAELKRLNLMYKEFEKDKSPVINGRSAKMYIRLTDSFVEILTQCPSQDRSKLFADLIHMHVNRLFVTDQRKHELIIYSFYISIRNRLKHMSRKIVNAG